MLDTIISGSSIGLIIMSIIANIISFAKMSGISGSMIRSLVPMLICMLLVTGVMATLAMTNGNNMFKILTIASLVLSIIVNIFIIARLNNYRSQYSTSYTTLVVSLVMLIIAVFGEGSLMIMGTFGSGSPRSLSSTTSYSGQIMKNIQLVPPTQ